MPLANWNLISLRKFLSCMVVFIILSYFFISDKNNSTFEQHNVLMYFPAPHPPLPTGTQNCSLPQMKNHYPFFFPAALMTLQPRLHISYFSFSTWQPFILWNGWTTNESPMHTMSPIQSLAGRLLLSLSGTEEPQWFFICLLRRQLFWVSSWLHSQVGQQRGEILTGCGALHTWHRFRLLRLAVWSSPFSGDAISSHRRLLAFKLFENKSTNRLQLFLCHWHYSHPQSSRAKLDKKPSARRALTAHWLSWSQRFLQRLCHWELPAQQEPEQQSEDNKGMNSPSLLASWSPSYLKLWCLLY